MRRTRSRRSRPAPGGSEPCDVLLACSNGGHLLQLLFLEEAWRGLRHVWVTESTSDTRSLLAGEPVVFAHGPATRSVGAFARNLALAWRLVAERRPKVVVTTGAGTAVPFVLVARARGARIVHVETLTRIDRPSLTCRLVAPLADRVYVQWPELRDAVRKGRYAGSVISR